MNKIFGFGIMAMVAAVASGCAGTINSKCAADVTQLENQAREQDREIADLNYKLATIHVANASNSILSETVDAASAAWGWAKVSIPDYYQATSDRVSAVRKCYDESAGNKTNLSYEDYKAIAVKCWDAK